MTFEQTSAPATTMTTTAGYRGRLAPSPTGHLHLGHARTFWIAYERARAADGVLVLRNEDLDPQRSRAEFVASFVEDLRWLGVSWQEGPDVGGPFAPYSQSERRALYLAAWRRLAAAGRVYPCSCSRRDLARAATAPHEGPPAAAPPHAQHPTRHNQSSALHDPHSTQHNQPFAPDDGPADDEPVYPGTCRPPADAPPPADDSPAGLNWRFRVPDGAAVSFDDLRQGRQSFAAGRDFGDFVVWRRDGVPSYQLACVVDDAQMRVTEVVRGADLLKSTARQLLLQRALALPTPAYYHCDLVRDERGLRLAKRHAALSLRALREQGRTPAQVRAMFAAVTDQP